MHAGTLRAYTAYLSRFSALVATSDFSSTQDYGLHKQVSVSMSFYSNDRLGERQKTSKAMMDFSSYVRQTQKMTTNFESDDRLWERWWSSKTVSLVLVKPTPVQSKFGHDPILVRQRGKDLMVWSPVWFSLSPVLSAHFILACTIYQHQHLVKFVPLRIR